MPLGSLLLEHSAIDGVSVCVETSDRALGYNVFMLLAAYGANGSLYIGRFRAVYSASSHFPEQTLYMCVSPHGRLVAHTPGSEQIRHFYKT